LIAPIFEKLHVPFRHGRGWHMLWHISNRLRKRPCLPKKSDTPRARSPTLGEGRLAAAAAPSRSPNRASRADRSMDPVFDAKILDPREFAFVIGYHCMTQR
jgi:hypothetical protein